ncbi:MAG: hypothetical protein Q8N54_16530 [Sulfurimicrobium sp.]|jgi:hypothetical protein|nr:hypothetical protein [Sulfurimicrobium sp.]MDP1705953.1 hypothetical protein [Sulfurimicrobium sp.]MDP2198754.1 hypothetical protein [Sulfurimicrobium sp.]MDP2964357.1 hypothetical protein [Sulfurimicrobium sp.]MDP3688036.1 hypothetical protein [Sulfurimicrobium sp.]
MSDTGALQSYKVITCFLPAGKGKEVLDDLRKQKGVYSGFVHHARGAGVDSSRGNNAPFYVEREVITVLAPVAQADEVFEFLYFNAGLDQPHTGMILMEKAIRGMTCNLTSEIVDES